MKRLWLLVILGLAPAPTVARADAAAPVIHAISVPMAEGEVVTMDCDADADDQPEYATGMFAVVNAEGGPKAGFNNSVGGFAGSRAAEQVVVARIGSEGANVAVPLPEEVRPDWDIRPSQGIAARPSVLKVLWAAWGGTLVCSVDVSGRPIEVPVTTEGSATYTHLQDFQGDLAVQAGGAVARNLHHQQDVSGFSSIFFLFGYGRYSWESPDGLYGGGTSTPFNPPYNAFVGYTDGTWRFNLDDNVATTSLPRVVTLSARI